MEVFRRMLLYAPGIHVDAASFLLAWSSKHTKQPEARGTAMGASSDGMKYRITSRPKQRCVWGRGQPLLTVMLIGDASHGIPWITYAIKQRANQNGRRKYTTAKGMLGRRMRMEAGAQLLKLLALPPVLGMFLSLRCERTWETSWDASRFC